ncbi:MAG: L-histidine N(alpha)-methyltransferase, partial [Burkholderiaceae bacterium]
DTQNSQPAIAAETHVAPMAPDQAILAGLQAAQASLPPKLFYDVLGSTLFTSICQLPEYYQTRTEDAIYTRFGHSMANRMPAGFRLVDLGAGDCRKAAGLIPVLKPAYYTPIDISGQFLIPAANAVAAEFPDVRVEPLIRDFTQAWQLPDAMRDEPIVYFYPGSSIGNFDPDDVIGFLENLRQSAAGPSQLLVGIDTVKSAAVLEAAYDDAIGVTAAFNRNALLNANAQLGTNFDVSQWDHRAVFNTALSRIEMHLVAREDLRVSWAAGERGFEQGETIHTESSYKYTRESFAGLLGQSGFSVQDQWQDGAGDFLVILAQTD